MGAPVSASGAVGGSCSWVVGSRGRLARVVGLTRIFVSGRAIAPLGYPSVPSEEICPGGTPARPRIISAGGARSSSPGLAAARVAARGISALIGIRPLVAVLGPGAAP